MTDPANEHTLTWKTALLATVCPPVHQLIQLFSLDQCDQFIQPDELNRLATVVGAGQWRGPTFVAESDIVSGDSRYYEQIVAQDFAVPTRQYNWHDLFNALIWLQFPETKAYLNHLHITDIDSYGVHPRTARRHRLTHFDECGVILAINENSLVQGNSLLEALASHSWDTAFTGMRDEWGKTVTPFIFGHANLEMLLTPFIGLTGKWLAVKVSAGFENMPLAKQLSHLDMSLKARIQHLADFELEPLLCPLPLLGVPGWHPRQDQAFYADKDYFRPRRATAPWTKQLPLK